MVRIKHRYLLINILYPIEADDAKQSSLKVKDELPWTVRFRQPSQDTFNAKLLTTLIRKELEDLFGDYGSGMTAGSLVVKYFSAATSTAIVRVARAHYRMVWSAMTFINKLPDGRACVFQVIRVSGTIRKSEEEAIRRARLSILRATPGSESLKAFAQGPDPDIDMVHGIEDHDEEDEHSD